MSRRGTNCKDTPPSVRTAKLPAQLLLKPPSPIAAPSSLAQVIKKDKLLGFTFTRALNGTGKGDMRSTTLNTTGAPLVPVMWALFPSWSVKDPAKDSPAPKDVHWEHATKVKEIDLSSGDEQEEAMADDAGFTKKHVAHGALLAGISRPLPRLPGCRGRPLLFLPERLPKLRFPVPQACSWASHGGSSTPAPPCASATSAPTAGPSSSRRAAPRPRPPARPTDPW